MAGTNVQAAKAALMARIKALPELDGIQVDYSTGQRDPERERIFGGKAHAAHTPSAMRGSGRVKREENASINVHIRVAAVGGDEETAEARAVELGTPIEDSLAGDPSLDTPAGVLKALVSDVELGSYVDDDGAFAALDYQISVDSYLT